MTKRPRPCAPDILLSLPQRNNFFNEKKKKKNERKKKKPNSAYQAE